MIKYLKYFPWASKIVAHKIYKPCFSLGDSSPEGADDGQEPVTGDGREGEHAGDHAEDYEEEEDWQSSPIDDTCVEHSYLTEYSREEELVLEAELFDQAVYGAPGSDHQVSYGEVHQVVVDGCPVRQTIIFSSEQNDKGM